jgi:hypothetical protein
MHLANGIGLRVPFNRLIVADGLASRRRARPSQRDPVRERQNDATVPAAMTPAATFPNAGLEACTDNFAAFDRQNSIRLIIPK